MHRILVAFSLMLLVAVKSTEMDIGTMGIVEGDGYNTVMNISYLDEEVSNDFSIRLSSAVIAWDANATKQIILDATTSVLLQVIVQYVKTELTSHVTMLIGAGVNVNFLHDESNSTALIAAATTGNVEILAMLLAAGANINLASKFTSTPLLVAVLSKHTDATKYLLDQGADHSIQDETGLTALLVGCFYGNDPIVQLLIDAGADVNKATLQHPIPPLGVAVGKEYETTTEILIAAGADVNTKVTNNVPLLNYACTRGNVKIVGLLLAAGADHNFEENTIKSPLVIAIEGNHFKIVEMLVEAGADINKTLNPLKAAVLRNRTTMVKYLLEHGAHYNATYEDGNSALLLACFSGNVKIVGLLLAAGADHNFEDNTIKSPLVIAIDGNHFKIVEMLVEAGADVKKSSYPLAAAVLKNDSTMAKYLLEHGANFNAMIKIKNEHSVLAAACYMGHGRIVEVLLAAGANPSGLESDKKAPLIVSIQSQNYLIVDMLIAAGADDGYGYSAIMYATRIDAPHIVEKLYEAGADLNLQASNGITALMYACINKKIGIAKYLIQKRCSIDMKNANGYTALTMARQNGDAEIVELLMSTSTNDALNRIINRDIILVNLVWVFIAILVVIVIFYYIDIWRKADAIGYNAAVDDSLMALCIDDDPLLTARNSSYYRGTYMNQAVAIKMFPHGGVLASEYKSILSLSHPHVLPVLKTERNLHPKYDAAWCLVTRFMPRGSLSDVLQGVRESDSIRPEYALTTLKNKIRLLEDVADGMNYLHEKNIIHGNLQSTNVMITSLGRGLISDIRTRDTRINHHDVTDDVYDFGLMMLEVLTDTKLDYNRTITIPKYLEESVPPGLIELLRQCLSEDSSRRPLFRGIFFRLHQLWQTCSEWQATAELHIDPRMLLKMTDIIILPTPLRTSPYSKVYRGTYRNTNIVLKFNTDANIQSSELDLLLSLRHPRILILLGVVRDSHQTFGASLGLVTEFMPRGSLHDVLHSKDTPKDYKLITLQSKLRVLMDVVEGMEYLHASNVLHRDLKSPNVLIDEDGRAKIGDFGISKMLEPNMTCATAIVGTHAWASPEALLQNEGVRKSTDVYSFGVILWEMLADEIPWRDVPGNQVIVAVSRGESLPIPASSEDEFEQQLIIVLEACLNWNQDLRPLFSDVAELLRNLLSQTVEREDRQRAVHSCPAQYICPISYKVMVDPVMCSDGHTYERESIERWFAEHDTSPNTNVPLSDKSLRPNITLRSLIGDYVAIIADNN